MSNPFYTYSGAFIPGILARAEAEAAEFQSVQAGFSLLAYQGVDSGAANAYVVTTNGAPTGTYADGQIVEFKAVNANTGNSTINVNSIGVVNIIQPNGQAVSGGAINANSWVRLVYNSTYVAFTLVAPTSLVTTSNTISAAAPAHLVGLTAAGGVATAVAPIDVTFALDQSIAPTWTGVHTFSNSVLFSHSISFLAGFASTGPANTYAAILAGSTTAGQSYGLEVTAGANASDICAAFFDKTGLTTYFKILGEGSVTVGNPTGGAKGVGTVNATGLYVNGTAVLTSAAGAANPTASVALTGTNGTATTFMRSDAAPALSVAIAPTWTGLHTFSGTGGVPVTINVPATQHGLMVLGGTNTANTYLVEFITAQASGFSSGLYIQAGTTSQDTALVISNASAGANFTQLYGNGEWMIVPPTTAVNQTTDFYQLGYVDAPRNLQNGNYTLAFKDRGKHIIKTGGSVGTWTIPVNGSVAFPIGTVIMLAGINNIVNSVSLVISGTATLNWAGPGTTGNRTLNGPWLATLLKTDTDNWLLSGAGIS